MTLEEQREETKTREITITVNENAVVVNGPRLSGRQIKETAIAQNVKIEMDFVLWQVPGHGNERKNIGDGDIVAVNKNSVFVAIDNDDDSR